MLTSESRCEPTSRFRCVFAFTRCVLSNGPLWGTSVALTSARRNKWLMRVHSTHCELSDTAHRLHSLPPGGTNDLCACTHRTASWVTLHTACIHFRPAEGMTYVWLNAIFLSVYVPSAYDYSTAILRVWWDLWPRLLPLFRRLRMWPAAIARYTPFFRFDVNFQRFDSGWLALDFATEYVRKIQT
jgi:hypothetical protein